MNEPVFFGLSLSLAFLYFVVWCMETVLCSVVERRPVSRGFLYGPICPIYGIGVLMMVCWFQPFMDRPVLFYLVATVCMSAWEYLVGWFLVTTTRGGSACRSALLGAYCPIWSSILSILGSPGSWVRSGEACSISWTAFS